MRTFLASILIVGFFVLMGSALASGGLSGPGSPGKAWAAGNGSSGPLIAIHDLPGIEGAAIGKPDTNGTLREDLNATGSSTLYHRIPGLANGNQYQVHGRAVTGGTDPWVSPAQQSPVPSAVRSFASTSVKPGTEVEITIAVAGYGGFGRVVETLPTGFSYVPGSSSLAGEQVAASGQELKFTLFGGPTRFSYTVTAPGTEGPYSFSGVLIDSDRNEIQVGGVINMTVSTRPSLVVSRTAGSQSAPVRMNSPISLTATFSESVTGFALADITVANGTVGALSGSGAVYTFEVTPNAIGEVTVNIAADVATDADRNGNTAAPQFSLGIPYDDDRNSDISRSEVIAAINDYLDGEDISRANVISLINLHLDG